MPGTCAHALVTKHQKRISGPLLDRIDTAKPHRSPACELWKVEWGPGERIIWVHRRVQPLDAIFIYKIASQNSQ